MHGQRGLDLRVVRLFFVATASLAILLGSAGFASAEFLDKTGWAGSQRTTRARSASTILIHGRCRTNTRSRAFFQNFSVSNASR